MGFGKLTSGSWVQSGGAVVSNRNTDRQKARSRTEVQEHMIHGVQRKKKGMTRKKEKKWPQCVPEDIRGKT